MDFFSNTNRTNHTNEGVQTGLCHTDFTDDTDFSNTAMDYFLQLQGVTILNNTRISLKDTRISLKDSRILMKDSRISLKVSRILLKDSRTSLKICWQKEIEGCAEMGFRTF